MWNAGEGFAEAAKMDTSVDSRASDKAFNSFDLVDLGLTTGGYHRSRSCSPFTVSTVPRAWSDSSRPHWHSRVQGSERSSDTHLNFPRQVFRNFVTFNVSN